MRSGRRAHISGITRLANSVLSLIDVDIIYRTKAAERIIAKIQFFAKSRDWARLNFSGISFEIEFHLKSIESTVNLIQSRRILREWS